MNKLNKFLEDESSLLEFTPWDTILEDEQKESKDKKKTNKKVIVAASSVAALSIAVFGMHKFTKAFKFWYTKLKNKSTEKEAIKKAENLAKKDTTDAMNSKFTLFVFKPGAKQQIGKTMNQHKKEIVENTKKQIASAPQEKIIPGSIKVNTTPISKVKTETKALTDTTKKLEIVKAKSAIGKTFATSKDAARHVKEFSANINSEYRAVLNTKFFTRSTFMGKNANQIAETFKKQYYDKYTKRLVQELKSIKNQLEKQGMSTFNLKKKIGDAKTSPPKGGFVKHVAPQIRRVMNGTTVTGSDVLNTINAAKKALQFWIP